MVGAGIDVIELSRMKATIARSGNLFLQRVFSTDEIEYGYGVEIPNNFFASAFAAKEAVFKAINLDWKLDIDFRDIEVGRGSCGEPTIQLSGTVMEQAEAKGCNRLLLTISYETDLAVALVIAD